jgi:pimeloyl-ACP methyl ester carboxylesterase
LLVCLLAAAGAQGAPLNSEQFPAPGQRVMVEGYGMHINCSGDGAPSVVLEAGLGGTSLEWSRVQPEVARLTRVCSRDRAGYGWSDAVPGPRTAMVGAEELRALLAGARVPGPYVLVGHSFGGLVVRLFAALNPHDVAAMVLIDTSHEAQFQRLERVGQEPPLAPTGKRFVIANHYQTPDGLPPSLRRIARRLALTPDATGALYAELGAIRWSAEELLAIPDPPRVPTVVLAHDAVGQSTTPAQLRRATAWLALQSELAQRTPGDRLLVVKDSGHHVHLDRPEVVIETIRSVISSFVGKR